MTDQPTDWLAEGLSDPLMDQLSLAAWLVDWLTDLWIETFWQTDLVPTGDKFINKLVLHLGGGGYYKIIWFYQLSL